MSSVLISKLREGGVFQAEKKILGQLQKNKEYNLFRDSGYFRIFLTSTFSLHSISLP